MDTAMPPLDHEKFLRRSLAVAQRAQSHGNHPFGAILVSGTGDILLEVENGYMPDRDMTGHAERLLATAASKQFEPKFLANCTLYTSAEPCCMCAGAAYWAGIGRVVYGLSERPAQDDHRQPRRKSARPTLPHRVRRRTAAGRSHRASDRG
jgi:tRNA(Arg) A34 adenosine deaminase TadA